MWRGKDTARDSWSIFAEVYSQFLYLQQNGILRNSFIKPGHSTFMTFSAVKVTKWGIRASETSSDTPLLQSLSRIRA